MKLARQQHSTSTANATSTLTPLAIADPQATPTTIMAMKACEGRIISPAPHPLNHAAGSFGIVLWVAMKWLTVSAVISALT